MYLVHTAFGEFSMRVERWKNQLNGGLTSNCFCQCPLIRRKYITAQYIATVSDNIPRNVIRDNFIVCSGTKLHVRMKYYGNRRRILFLLFLLFGF